MRMSVRSEDLLKRVAELEAIVTAIGPYFCQLVEEDKIAIMYSAGEREVDILPALHELCHTYIAEWYPVETTVERLKRLGLLA